MTSINLKLISQSDLKFVTFCPEEAGIIFIKELLSIFDLDPKNITQSVKCNQEVRQHFKNVCESYRQDIGKNIMGVYAFVQSIKDNEQFCFIISPNDIVDDTITNIQIALITINVSEQKDDKQLEEIVNKRIFETLELSNRLQKHYDIIPFSNLRQAKFIGQKNSFCRFCGKTPEEGATFYKKAHTVPEGLGNKKLFTYEECDNCNAGRISELEQDLQNFLLFFKTFYSIKGKKRIPNTKDANGELEIISIKNKTPEQISALKSEYMMHEDLSGKDVLIIQKTNTIVDEVSELKIKSREKVKLVNVYKALCKIVVELIPREQIEHLKGTIDWINNDGKYQKLPAVIRCDLYNKCISHPEVIIYIRKTCDTSLPFMAAEIHLFHFVFFFIIPNTNQDIIDYTSPESYRKFINVFRHITLRNDLTKHSLDDVESKEFIMNIKLPPIKPFVSEKFRQG